MALRRSRSLFGTDRAPEEDGYMDPVALKQVRLKIFFLQIIFVYTPFKKY